MCDFIVTSQKISQKLIERYIVESGILCIISISSTYLSITYLLLLDVTRELSSFWIDKIVYFGAEYGYFIVLNKIFLLKLLITS